MRRVHDGEALAGEYTTTLDLGGVGPSVYFLRLKTAEASITRVVVTE